MSDRDLTGPPSRRDFIATAAAIGAAVAFPTGVAAESTVRWRENREAFPEGVASGDPTYDSVILWTRRPFEGRQTARTLTAEIATDEAFTRVVATAQVNVSTESDWTGRLLVGKLEPARVYWYRFTDGEGNGSRIGRTVTAPLDTDPRPVKFAFVSCQNVNQGAQNAYRRMIFDDERAAPDDRLGFVLHLGDFIYEIVWYPEDRPQGMYDRTLRDIVRYPTGEKISDFHIPVTLDDYRAVYRAYLRDPDIQDARARWPFVVMWDNHEFSWKGWQSVQKFDATNRPAQTRKVAANQAWFEYQPARVIKPSGKSLDRFDPPVVRDVPLSQFDRDGLSQEPNNLVAINSLQGYRALRFGRNMELLITDQHSYRSEDPTDRAEFARFASSDFPGLYPEEAQEILDAGRTHGGGHPPATIRFGDTELPNYQQDLPAQTILGAAQKKWFLERLRSSKATWKIWGNSLGTLDWRADPQNLPAGTTLPWPGRGYAGFAGGDYGAAYVERGEIYDLVRREGVTGFVTVAGDRHSFWAGYAAKALPPRSFDPVGVAFITGSVSAPGLVEAWEHRLPKDHPLRALFLADRPAGRKPEAAVNLLMRHGVRACLEYRATGDPVKARARRNPELSPHLEFVDMAGHGFATVRVASSEVLAEFVCIERPVERSPAVDGGPLRYRVAHRAKLWAAGDKPLLEQTVVEGDPGLAI